MANTSLVSCLLSVKWLTLEPGGEEDIIFLPVIWKLLSLCRILDSGLLFIFTTGFDILTKIRLYTKMLGETGLGGNIFVEIEINVELEITMLRKTVYLTENTRNMDSFN